MFKPVLVAIGMLVLLATGASAASFDCKKAATAYEKALCTSPELGKLDETLARAWATAIGGLSKPAADTMRVGQRSWLDYIQRDCTTTGEVPPAYSEDDYNCLQSDLHTRVRDLEQSRMLNGLRFYMQGTFSVTPTVGTGEWDKPSTRSLSYPLIDSTEPLAGDFNAFTAKSAQAALKAAGTETDEDSAEIDQAITISVIASRDRRISMRVDDNWLGHGAAHPNYSVSYMHYLTEENRALRVDDIFTGKAWRNHLAGLVTAALKDLLGDAMWDYTQPDIAEWVADTGRWDLSDNGLIVQFQPYEVTAYAWGAPSVTIPWEKLTDDLTSDALAIVTY